MLIVYYLNIVDVSYYFSPRRFGLLLLLFKLFYIVRRRVCVRRRDYIIITTTGNRFVMTMYARRVLRSLLMR